MKVCKFGGSSVANAAQIQKVLDIVLADPDRRIVVVSAPGKRDKTDTKVTDLLIECARRGVDGNHIDPAVEAVVERFRSIQLELGLPEALLDEIREDLLARVHADADDEGPYTDCIKAAGEDFSARFVAAAFRARGVHARYVDLREAGMILSDEFGSARLLDESYPLLKAYFDGIGDDIAIVPGFFGFTRAGKVATFPRGGSDITGSIVAAAVHADEYENFTDVDSVFPVDPRIVPEVSGGIREMTYREMRELSYAGFGVFHDEAIHPAVVAEIPIRIKNTNHPDAEGTRIVARRKIRHGNVIGVACADGFCTIHVGKYLMNRDVGFGRRLLQILEENGIPFDHAPTGVDNINVILQERFFPPEIRERVLNRIRDELGAEEVSFEPGLALLMIVGEGMRYSVGLAARAIGAISAANINVEMLNQGSSEISIMIGIRAGDRKAAIRAMYHEFFLPKNS